MLALDDIHARTIAIYERNAQGWDAHRPRVLFERHWLDRFIDTLNPGGRVLDVGCGAGDPIAGYLIERGFDVTGIDASEAMLDIAKSRYPQADWVRMDMRQLNLDTGFDGILSWDALFHLKQDEQRNVLPLFVDHLKQGGSLLLTIGDEAGEVVGTVEGEKVYHASLAPQEYESMLKALGFARVDMTLKDETCGHHSILLATGRRIQYRQLTPEQFARGIGSTAGAGSICMASEVPVFHGP